MIVRRTTLRSAGWSVLQRGHDAVCRPRYPISPGSTDDPFALLEWPSDDPARVPVPAGLTPLIVPAGRSPMQPFSPARSLPDRWVSGQFRPSSATISPPGTTSPSRPRSGPPCNRSGGHERAVQRVCAADVRCAGWLRSADSPALPRGSRPRFGRQQWVVCCARRRLTPVAVSATSAPLAPL